MKYDELVNEPTPQTEPLDKRQVANNTGGFVYGLDKWKRLERFLILGSDSNTYYQSAKALTKENAACVLECFAEDALRTAETIKEISHSGRAPKNDPAIFALALGAVSTDAATRQISLNRLKDVCRTSTHLFSFVKAAKGLGKGFGRGMKRAIADWYTSKTIEQVAYQAIKYRQREGYTHKRLLDMSHAPSKGDPNRNALYLWMKGKEGLENFPTHLPSQILSHLYAMRPESSREYRIGLVKASNLPWEALPTECNSDPLIWEAMLPKMGLTALIRNLGNMTKVGTISPLSEAEQVVVRRLSDPADLKLSRIHPFHVLQAMAVYRSGQGFKGSGSWTPSVPVLDALDAAFYQTFANVIPSNKNFLIGLDVSGSMTSPFSGSVLSCRDASAALALVTMATEPTTHVVGFTAKGSQSRLGIETSALTPLNISPRQRLTDAIQTVSNLPFGSTDCSLPMLYALEQNLKVDTFLILTDSETYAGRIHPMAALKKYRQETGINAKLIVVGMTSTGFSIADPQDAGCLDVVGFDSNVPALISDFSRN